MFSTVDVFISFGWVLILILLSFSTAQVFKLLAKAGGRPTSLFSDFFIGLFTMVSIYAIIRTRGLTVLLPIPFLSFYLMKAELLRSSIDPAYRRKEQIFLGLSVVLQFLFFLSTLVSFDGETVRYIAGDFSIYYRMADRLNTYGVEAYNFNINMQPGSPSPYHFGDLWLYAMVGRLVSLNPSVLFLVAFTVLSSLFTMGMYTYALGFFKTKFRGNYWFVYVLIFSGLFASLRIVYPSFLMKYAEPYTFSIFNWGKVILISCGVMALLILIQQKKWIATALVAIMCCLLYLNATPAIFGALFVLLLLAVAQKKIAPSIFFKANSLYIGVTVAYLLILYKLVPMMSPQSAVHTYTAPSIFQDFGVLKYLRTALNIFIGGFFQFLTLLPFGILLLLALLRGSNKQELKQKILQTDFSIIFVVLLFFAGLASWAALYPLSVDTVQFFHNILAPIYSVAISLLLLYVFYVTKSKVIILLTTLLTALSVYQSVNFSFYSWRFDRSDWEQMRAYFRDKEVSGPFVNIKSMGELGYWSSKKTDQYVPLSILSYCWHDYHNISLNAPFILPDEHSVYRNEEEKDIKLSTFSTFYEDQLSSGVSELPQIVDHFTTKFNVGFVAVSHDTSLPLYLRARVEDSLFLPNTKFTIFKIGK